MKVARRDSWTFVPFRYSSLSKGTLAAVLMPAFVSATNSSCCKNKLVYAEEGFSNEPP